MDAYARANMKTPRSWRAIILGGCLMREEPHDNHHWTAGADSCARRGGVAACGARAATEGADDRRAGQAI
jgi:hypothetical protein